MNVLVAIKRVVDYNIKVRAKPDGSAVDIAGVKMSVNPFDENAIEAALQLKEQGVVSHITVVTIGPNSHQDSLRHALAMGADDALLIETDEVLQSLGVAKVLKQLVDTMQPQLVLLGKQAIDDDAGQTGQMLAALLNYPQATYASHIEINGLEATVVREIDGGTETIAIHLPAVITADLRLNEPRFVKLPQLMLARKKQINTVPLASLDLDTRQRLIQLRVEEPPPRAAGIMVDSVDALVSQLIKHEGIFA